MSEYIYIYLGTTTDTYLLFSFILKNMRSRFTPLPFFDSINQHMCRVMNKITLSDNKLVL